MIEENIKSNETALAGYTAEEQFIPDEHQFRKLIENAPDGIAIVGIDGKFKYVSPSAKKIFGYDSDADIAIDPNESTHPEDLNRVQNALHELVIDPSLVATLQYRFLNSDGTWHWIESTFSTVLNEPGIEGFIINFRSIEERKRIEDKLVKKKALYSTLFNLSPAGIMLEDMYGNIIDINDTYLSITGYGREELVGHNIRKIVPPEYLDEVEKNIARIKSGETLIYEISTLRKGGTRIEIELRETMITLPNDEKGIIVVAHDISERKKAETEIRLQSNMLNTIGQAVVSTDLQGHITYWNKAAERIYGWAVTEVMGHYILDIIPSTVSDKQTKEIMESLNERIAWSGEFSVKRKDGTLFPVFATISPVLNIYGELIGIIATSIDITERINHLKMIEQSSKQLRALSLKIEDLREEERTAIARELHDELGQILTAIKIDLQTIANHPPNKSDTTKYINPVVDLVEQSIVSIRKLSSDLRPTILDHLGLVSAMEWYIAEQKKRLKTDITFKIPAAIGKISKKKTIPVFRVFQELLTNIARHAHASIVIIKIEVVDSTMKLIVSDNGVGMNTDSVDNIKSLGILGMKERLNAIGGILSYSSTPGSGTTALVLVPLIHIDEIV